MKGILTMTLATLFILIAMPTIATAEDVNVLELTPESITISIKVWGATTGEKKNPEKLSTEEVKGATVSLRSKDLNHIDPNNDIASISKIDENNQAVFSFPNPAGSTDNEIWDRFWLVVTQNGKEYWGFTGKSDFVRKDKKGNPGIEIIFRKDSIRKVPKDFKKDIPSKWNVSPERFYGRKISPTPTPAPSE